MRTDGCSASAGLHPGQDRLSGLSNERSRDSGDQLAAFHDFRLIEQLIACGASELIFVMGSHQFKRACQVSSKDELITIRPSPRGLAVAVMLAVALRRTRFGEGVKNILIMIARHWYGLPRRPTTTPCGPSLLAGTGRGRSRPASAFSLRSAPSAPES